MAAPPLRRISAPFWKLQTTALNPNLINSDEPGTYSNWKRDSSRRLWRPARGKRKQQVRRIPRPILISGIRETCATLAAAAFIFRARCNKCYFCSRRANLAHCDGHISRKLRAGYSAAILPSYRAVPSLGWRYFRRDVEERVVVVFVFGVVGSEKNWCWFLVLYVCGESFDV